MPHEDGDAYARIVATVSLGGCGCLDITAKKCESIEDDGSAETGKDDDHEETTIGDSADVQSNLDTESTSSRNPPQQQYKLPTRILYEPRSLLITTGSAYSTLMHGISEVLVDENLNADTVANWTLLGEREKIEANGGRMERETRISLTYRDVLKVKGGFLFWKK